MRTSPKNSNIFEWKSQKELIPYPEAMKWMENRVQDLQKGEATPCAWFLEHPPLYTLGSRGKEEDIFSSAKLPVFNSGRGGQVTYHGPGQRIVYLMIDLKSHYEDIRRYVYELEGWIIDALHHLGIQGERREGRVGIWVQKEGKDSKIAALGVRVQKWVTSHGFALNINPNLKAYDDIIPCGLSQYGVTSLQDLGVVTSMEEVDAILHQTCPFDPCA
ncbi:lipoyl(octanoyl) transferase LipB [Kamptonema cortianum]|nr:lipoyl(octanoyl) transferase LipB [Kamptonema cortianum]